MTGMKQTGSGWVLQLCLRRRSREDVVLVAEAARRWSVHAPSIGGEVNAPHSYGRRWLDARPNVVCGTLPAEAPRCPTMEMPAAGDAVGNVVVKTGGATFVFCPDGLPLRSGCSRRLLERSRPVSNCCEVGTKSLQQDERNSRRVERARTGHFRLGDAPNVSKSRGERRCISTLCANGMFIARYQRDRIRLAD